MNIRTLTAEDLERASFLASHAFRRGGETIIPMERWMSPDRTRIGIDHDGELAACFSIQDFTLIFGEELYPCGGICGVMTDPGARGRGYADALIRRGLEIMREKGQYLSNLWPFNFSFYQGYGWDWTGWYHDVKVPLSMLKSDSEAKKVRLVREDSWDVLADVYRQRASRSHGAVRRTEAQWRAKFGKSDGRERLIFLYQFEGNAEGYAFLRYDSEPHKGTINEFAALTPRAWKGLLGALHNMSMTIDDATFQLGMQDDIWAHLVHWSLESKRKPDAMGRIVDFQAALQARKVDTTISGTCTVEVEDKHASWNYGKWKIEASNGALSVKKSTGTAGVSLDIRSISQAYWGSPSWGELESTGRVVVRNPADLEFLKSILPAKGVWLQDDF
ncbi:MAG: GNAT family N-acetyltransferase [Chthonomonadales bacterium]